MLDFKRVEEQIRHMNDPHARYSMADRFKDADTMQALLDAAKTLQEVDRWLAIFVAAWDKSRDKKKPSEASVALMEAIRQHSAVRNALNKLQEQKNDD